MLGDKRIFLVPRRSHEEGTSPESLGRIGVMATVEESRPSRRGGSVACDVTAPAERRGLGRPHLFEHVVPQSVLESASVVLGREALNDVEINRV